MYICVEYCHNIILKCIQIEHFWKIHSFQVVIEFPSSKIYSLWVSRRPTMHNTNVTLYQIRCTKWNLFLCKLNIINTHTRNLHGFKLWVTINSNISGIHPPITKSATSCQYWVDTLLCNLYTSWWVVLYWGNKKIYKFCRKDRY